MPKLNFEEYDRIIAQCREITLKKNADYGCNTLFKFACKGVVVRLNDKMERLINLIWNENKRQVQDEKVEDTVLDMINYCVYLIMLLRGKLTKDGNGY